MLKSLLLMGLLVGLLSACTVQNTNQATHIPRDSFIYIKQEANYVVCNIKSWECRTFSGKWTASGVLVAKDEKKDKAFVLTAAHVCKGAESDFPYVIIVRNEEIIGYTLDGYSHEGMIVAMDERYDLCLFEIEYVDNDVSGIAKAPPEPGERIYNAAAPAGYWNANMVILLEGFFSGNRKQDMVMSIPAAPGSSGSPIYNNKGEIIGILHSVARKFNNISVATRWRYVRKFLIEHLKEFDLEPGQKKEMLDNITEK